MAIDVQTQVFTIDEFEQYADSPDNIERALELVDGIIVEKDMPTRDHGIIVHNISFALGLFIEAQSIDGLISIETRHRAQNDTSNARIPDLSYMREDRKVDDSITMPHMPDFAVEVLSPGQSLPKMREKAQFYLANGVALVWIVVPQKRTVEVFTVASQAIFGIEDTIEGGAVLSEFHMTVRAIFKKTSMA